MYRVIIADDEPVISNGIQSFIDWNSLQCEIVGQFSNGIDVLSFLSEHEVDIVITDIKMPQLSGIDLAKKIYEYNSLICVIILTGYADFCYAQEAINNHVSSYIVKKDIQSQLPSAVKKCIAEIEEGHSAHQTSDSSHQFTASRELESCKNSLRNIITGATDYSPSLNQQINEIYPDAKGYIVISLNIFDEVELFKIEDVFRHHIESILNFIEMSLKDYAAISFIKDNTEIISILLVENSFQTSKLIETMTSIISFTASLMKLLLNIGISPMQTDFAAIKDGYTNAIKSLSNEHYKVADGVYLFNLTKPVTQTFNSSTTISSLLKAVRSNNKIEALKQLDMLFEEYKENFETLEKIKYESVILCSEIVKITDTYGALLDSSSYIINLNPIFQSITNAVILGSVKSQIALCIDLALSSLTQTKTSGESMIDQVNAIIRREYASNLTLQKIANDLHINSNYLSRMYAGKTGMSFSKALSKYRIELSKDFLLNSNLKILEIAEKVGIKEAGYFCNVFTKHTGLSPQKYRNTYMKV